MVDRANHISKFKQAQQQLLKLAAECYLSIFHDYFFEMIRIHNPLIWLGLMFTVLLSCKQDLVMNSCQLQVITSGDGDTLSVLNYDENGLERINLYLPSGIRRFVYDNGVVVREEWFGPVGNLNRFRAFSYRADSALEEIISYGLNANGQWEPVQKELLETNAAGQVILSKIYQIEPGLETLSAYRTREWRGELLTQESSWQQHPGDSSVWQLASTSTFTYDNNNSPWPNLPPIDPWKYRRNLSSEHRTLFEYLPGGDTLRLQFQRSIDYLYNKSGYPTEAQMTDWGGQLSVEKYQYVCEETLR